MIFRPKGFIIGCFQDNEYRSRVFSLVAHVKKIADFQTEILENDELRLSKIAQLDSLEEKCTQLLGQANLTLAGFAKKTGLDYKEYEKALENAQNWFMYQKSLLDILYKISDLRYTIHLGAVSREQCSALLPTYTKQVSDTQERLTTWHQETTEYLGIDTDEIRRKRAGFDRVIYFGVIGAILWQGKEYRMATYLGARVVQIQNKMVRVIQGNLELDIRLQEASERPLKAPAKGDMVRTIHESASCRAFYRFRQKDHTLFAFETDRASCEFEYPESRIYT